MAVGRAPITFRTLELLSDERPQDEEPRALGHRQHLVDDLLDRLALDRKRINEAACLGFCPPAGVIVPLVEVMVPAARQRS